VDGVDGRVVRLEQTIVTLVLLTGFVFSLGWTIPAAAILVAADAGCGDAGPVPWLWRATIAHRVAPARTFEERAGVRMHAAIVGGALAVATILLYLGIGPVAVLLAILVAAVTTTCAAGLGCLGCELHRRLAR